MNDSEQRIRVLHVTIAPPENHCGVRLVMHRHLVERQPFELLVATNADYFTTPGVHVALQLPYVLHRVRKSRFGPPLRRWIADVENLIWPCLSNQALEQAVRTFRPHVVLTLADNHLGEISRRLAKRHRLPLAGLFLDWVPIMDGYFGHRWSCPYLSHRFRRLYADCDLAFCTSDGMREELGPHPNCHVVYPMPGRHQLPTKPHISSEGKFRVVYVGSVRGFYGRMLCALLERFESLRDMELIVIGPDADWPTDLLERARSKAVYLGFKPAQEAADLLAGADALLVVMSFEKQYELFMKTSFTTKLLDYAAFRRPVILWGPQYCSPFRMIQEHGGALTVDQQDPDAVVAACRRLLANEPLRGDLAEGAGRLHATLFNPDRLQRIFVAELTKVAESRPLAV